jgi:hypothetical protein
LRWDASAQAGLAKRLTTGGAPGAGSPDFGPVVQLETHVAVIPMVRGGFYLAEDLAPVSGGVREFTAAGLHARLSPPLLDAPWRTWLAFGLGFSVGYDTARAVPGELFDVPVGLGLGNKVGAHTLLFAEGGARFGFGHYGAMYDGSAAASTSSGTYLGHDVVALSLTVGLSLDE